MAAEEDRVVIEESPKKLNKKQKGTVIDCFSKLISPNEKIRVKSGTSLIKNFVLNQSDQNNVVEVKHALARLIRGTGATKNVSRIGFYSTLCALLKTVDFDVGEILDFINSELHLSGSNTRSENADIALGHILVCGAVLRSGHFQQTSTENQHKILKLLITAGNKKTYLTSIAYRFLVEALDTLPTSDFQKSVIPIITPEITKPLENVGLDNLYFLIVSSEKFPKVVGKKFLKSTVQKPEIIHKGSVKSIVDILLGILPVRELLLHPVYELVAKKIGATELVPSFIQEIDKALQSRATVVRIHAAAVLITLITENLTNKTYLPNLISKTFLTETLSYFNTLNFKNHDDIQITIHRLFESLVTALQTEVSTETKLSIINLLLFDPGSFTIEKLTGSKVLQQITTTLDTDGVKQLAEIYREVLLGHKSQAAGRIWMAHDRIYAAQLIVKLLRHPSVKGELHWKIEQLKMLMDLGIIQSTSVSYEIAVKLKETFFNALDLKLPKLEDLSTVLSTLLHHLDSQISEENFETVMCKPFTSADYELWRKGVDAVRTLEKKKTTNPVFHTLFLHMSLQLFNNKQVATDSLNELFECYQRLKIEKKLKNEDKEEEIKWIEVIVDLFLNMLSHSSHLFRSIIGVVFPHLCKDLTPTAIHQILSVLDPKSDDNPLDENFEELGGEECEDDESDEDDDEEMESEEEKFEETVNDKLRQAVRAALGSNGAVTDEEDVDVDEMSENEGEQLNSTLGAAFKQFKPKLSKHSKKQSKDDMLLTHFRVRVLDLIDIYLDSEVSMIICVEIMLPLLHVLEFCIKDPHQKPLLERVNYCLKKLTKVKDFAAMEDVSDEILPELLKSLIQKGLKSTILVQEMDEKISDACIFIINCMKAIGNEEVEKKIIQILSEALDTFFEKRDCLTPFVLFKNIFRLSWAGTVNFIPSLVKYIFNEEIRPFRRSQGIELLKLFYSNKRLLTTSTKIKKVQKIINAEALKTLNTPQSNTKERFIVNLLRLLTLIKTSPLENLGMQWDEIAEAVREYRSSVNFSQDAKKAFNKLCQALKISNVVKIKANVIKLSIVNNEEVVPKEERKRRKNKEKKSKKEKQLLRSKCNSEGLEDLSFSGIEKVEDMQIADGSSDSGVDAGVEVNGFEKKRRTEGVEKSVKKKIKTN